MNVKILMFNNEVYGLTKGQYSPTSPVGQRSKTSPFGSVDRPFNPVSFALGSNATFVARTIDTHQKHMEQVLLAAAEHKGAAFVEIYQNCVIFNADFYDQFATKGVRDENTIDLRPGQPMVYGKEHDKGLRVQGFDPERCSADEAGVWKPDVTSSAPAFLMSQLDHDPEMPRPIGIFRNVEAPVYEDVVQQHAARAIESKGEGKLRDLLYSGDMWEVK